MVTTNKRYTAESIKFLCGLDSVRKLPSMYTDISRPNHLAQEVIDNSVDEAIAGYASLIKVILYSDGALEVEDNGRGIPVDLHPKNKIPAVELILTRLHAGAKFINKDYRFSGGRHGVGVSVVNALSKRLEVTIKRNGYRYTIDFSHGKKVSKLKKQEKVTKSNTGTTVKFWPNKKYFNTDKFLISKLRQVLQMKAVLYPGLSVVFEEQNTGKIEQWLYESGLTDYLKGHVKGEILLPNEPFIGNKQKHDGELTWAVVWTPEYKNNFQESYVNLIATPLGGTHVNGFRTGLLEAICEFCVIHKFLPKGVKLLPDDIWRRVNFILSVKITNVQFSGQTKERLVSRQCSVFVQEIVKDAFNLWLNQHIYEAKVLVDFVIKTAQKRLQESRKVVRKKVTSCLALPGKLTDCTSQDPERSELFLVEGDSAGGSAKQARDREFQAVMPLKGKILNTWELNSSQVLASKEVYDIAVAIGVDPGGKILKHLRYGKICILVDADSDGKHIATLLCALFMRHFQSLILAGHIFVAMPPLYRIDVGKNVYYALDDEEKQGVLERIRIKKIHIKPNVQRFKGLGEMNPVQLRLTTMSPDTRRLVQLTIDSEVKTKAMLDILFSKKRAFDRHIWLEGQSNLALL